MKRFVCLILSLLLVLTCIGMADENPALTQRMTDVTRLVKTVLDISDEYTDFEGSFSGGRWYLNWSMDGSWIGVSCLEDGTVLTYDRYSEEDEKELSGTTSVRFPKLSPEELEERAKAFLSRVLTAPGWGWELESFRSSLNRGYFSGAMAAGRLTFNGLATDIGFSISIDPMSGKVCNYYRYDAYTKYNELPEVMTVPEDTQDALEEARAKLLEAYELEAVYYVTDVGEMAHLVYMRKDSGKIALDCESGELVSFDPYGTNSASAKGMDRGYGEAEDSAGTELRALTETELKGIALYDDVMSPEELDAALKGMPELMLKDGDLLSDSNYYISQEKPYANLTYYRDLGKDNFIEMSFCLDARTGSLLSMYSYTMRASETDSEKADPEAWQTKAEAFIGKYYPEKAENIRLTASDSGGALTGTKPCVTYTFSRQHRGYLFRADSISVTVDTEDGSICAFNMNWNDGQEFFEYEPEELIDPETAKLKWLEGSELSLMYLSVPQKDARDVSYTLRLCRCFDETQSVYAVDAASGERYSYNTGVSSSQYEYPESAEMLYADEIRTLGLYGIGLADCGFTGQDKLQGRQIMRLCLQVRGYTLVDEYTDEQLERAFKNCFPGANVSLNAEAAYTRTDMANMLVILAGYGDAAKLEGIWKTDAADWDEVPKKVQGSLAIAWALGLIELEDGSFNWSAPAATAEFMHGIYVLLSK